jgi:hypothetical protein
MLQIGERAVLAVQVRVGRQQVRLFTTSPRTRSWCAVVMLAAELTVYMQILCPAASARVGVAARSEARRREALGPSVARLLTE